MPDLRAVEDHPEFEKLNTLVQNLVVTIKNKQATYYAANKKFFQGLETPDSNVVECDGLSNLKIDEKRKPSDQKENWKDFDSTVFATNATLPFHVRIDVYKTPHKGWGWVLTVKYKYEDDVWIYRHDEGPGSLGGPWDEWFLRTPGGSL